MKKKIKFGTGAIPIPYDPREVAFGAIITGAPVVDWEVGFDVEDEIGKLIVENQGASQSCVANGWSKYAEALDRYDRKYWLSMNKTITPDMIYPKVDLSARFIYSQIYLPQGGAYIYKGGTVLTSKGDASEVLIPSYQDGKPPTEDFMRVADLSPEVIADAAQYQGSSYASVNVNNIDELAYAIQKNKGVVMGFQGDSNTMTTAFIQKPVNPEWGHAVYCTGFKIINGKKYIKFINSWSAQWGENGYGYIGEEWFGSSYLFNAYTLVDIPQNWKQITQMLKLIKLADKAEQYIVVENTRYAIPDLETKALFRDKLKIILDEPQIVSDLNAFQDGGKLPSVSVCNSIAGIYSVLKDAFEVNAS